MSLLNLVVRGPGGLAQAPVGLFLLRVALNTENVPVQPPEPHLLSGSVTKRLLSAGRVLPVNLKLHF